MTPSLEAPTTVNVPSADLINYRFDQTDKKFEDVGTKLDQILIQNQHFVTEDRVAAMIADSLRPIHQTFEIHRWYWRAIFTATLLALGTAVANLILKH